MILLLVACSREEPPAGTGSSPDPDETADTGDTLDTAQPEPQVKSASCALTSNALRVSCTASMDLPGSLTLALQAPGAPTRTFSSAEALQHEILGWGLLPETAYTWTLGPFTGEITTGRLPSELDKANIVTTGTSWGFDAVLHPMACFDTDYFTLIDGEGRIVWYEPNAVYFNGTMTGYEWNQDSKTVLSVNGGRFLEQHVSGEVVLELATGLDFYHTLHHDTERWGDYRYLLFEYDLPAGPGQGRPADGVHVFEGSTWKGTFLVADHFVPSDGFGDWTHANGLQATSTGELIVSLLNYDTVLSIDGDPASPTFLQLNWHAVGSGFGLPEPDYTPIPGELEGFSRQHNASLRDDMLWVFDNRSQRHSRAARYRIDPAQGTLALDAAWSFGVSCSNQGGALPIEGGVLASCANSGLVWAFYEDETEPDWTLEAACGAETGLPITRAIPVFIE